MRKNKKHVRRGYISADTKARASMDLALWQEHASRRAEEARSAVEHDPKKAVFLQQEVARQYDVLRRAHEYLSSFSVRSTGVRIPEALAEHAYSEKGEM